MSEREECPNCLKRNIAVLDDKLMECHDCGITFSVVRPEPLAAILELTQRCDNNKCFSEETKKVHEALAEAVATTRWSMLYQRFKKLAEKTGKDKSSSYIMNIIFSPDDEHGVELGCYDIADWPRTLYLGPFKTEEEMFKAVEAKIAEAEVAVEEQMRDNEAEAKIVEEKMDAEPDHT